VGFVGFSFRIVELRLLAALWVYEGCMGYWLEQPNNVLTDALSPTPNDSISMM